MTSDDRTDLLHEARRLMQSGRVEDAARLCEGILSVDPASVLALHELGILEIQRNAIDKGRALLERAVVLAPEDATLRWSTAAVLAAIGRFEEAAPVAREAVRLSPGSWEAAPKPRDDRRGNLAAPEQAEEIWQRVACPSRSRIARGPSPSGISRNRELMRR